MLAAARPPSVPADSPWFITWLSLLPLSGMPLPISELACDVAWGTGAVRAAAAGGGGWVGGGPSPSGRGRGSGTWPPGPACRTARGTPASQAEIAAELHLSGYVDCCCSPALVIIYLPACPLTSGASKCRWCFVRFIPYRAAAEHGARKRCIARQRHRGLSSGRVVVLAADHREGGRSSAVPILLRSAYHWW